MIPPPLRFVQAFLLYLPTTFLLPNAALIVYAMFSVLVFDPSFSRKDRLYFLFFIGVGINALLGILIDQQFPDSLFVNNGLLGAVILVFGYLAARSLNDTVWKIILFFLVIEVICIYIQFALGIRFFFPQQEVVTTTTEFRLHPRCPGHRFALLHPADGIVGHIDHRRGKSTLGLCADLHDRHEVTQPNSFVYFVCQRRCFEFQALWIAGLRSVYCYPADNGLAPERLRFRHTFAAAVFYRF